MCCVFVRGAGGRPQPGDLQEDDILGGHFGESKRPLPGKELLEDIFWGHLVGAKRPLPGNGHQEDIFWMYGPMGSWGMSYIAKMCGYIWDPPQPV